MSVPVDGLDDLGGSEPPPDDIVAGEYVLGVLDPAARLTVEARIAAETGFAGLVSAWQRRLAPLSLEPRPIEVPSRVWIRVQERLGWSSGEPADSGLGRRLNFWRLTAGVAATVALALLALDFAPRWIAPKVSETQLAKAVTTLSRDDGAPGWLATVDVRRGTVLMVPVPRPPDSEGRAAELWLIPAGQAPRSLGAVSFDHAHTVAVPAAWRADLNGKALLAITLEPHAGIPHAAPTGPIIAKGPIQL